jgi:hypothetical protein
VKSINRKLNAIENQVLQPFEWGSTQWTVQDDAEQRLYDQVAQIGKTVKFNDLTPEQLKLIDEAEKRIWLHGIDLFNSMIGGFIHHDTPTGKRLWNMWLGYFIQEASVGITQMILEEEIFSQEGKSWKQKEKEADALPKFVKVFTRERFEQYISDVIERSLKPEIKAKLEKARKNKVKLSKLSEMSNLDGSKMCKNVQKRAKT